MRQTDRRSIGALQAAAFSAIRGAARIEALEPRQLLSASNALDELDFGNLASEASHHFDPGISASQLPVQGTGTVGASAGLTYRDPTTGSSMVFTLGVDPNRQDYFTVKFWGNDAPATVTLANSPDAAIGTLETAGGPVIYPNRFYYYTYAIPIASTSGVSSVQLHLDIAAPGKPVYSVFTTTNPAFVPASSDATGTAPTLTGEATLTALTAAEAVGTTASPGILLSNRQAIYGSGGTYSQVLADQITTANAPNAPPEVIGLDLFTNVANWVAANPNATADQWHQQIAYNQPQTGYTAFPDELLTLLTTTYLLQPFVDSNGNTVSGLDDYHDSALIGKIVSTLDGVSYEQDSDGGFIQQGHDAAANSAWTGLTSTARTTGNYAGSSARESTVHGGGDLEGSNTYGLGWSLLSLLNDPTAAPILESYLNENYDANLTGNSSTYVLRATAYERMLYNAVQFYQTATGGTESQNMFQETAMYAADVALAKLQSLYPNSAYPANSATALNYAEQLMGLIQDVDMRGVGFDGGSPYSPSTVPNYGLTLDGLGEANGALSTGFDGGGYGQYLPALAPRIVQIATWDTTVSAASLASFEAVANNTINTFDQFLEPMNKATVNSSGVVTSDTFSFNAEPFITYRDTKDLNTYAGSFNFNSQYPASDPTGPIDNAYALRAAYLETQYGVTFGMNSLDWTRDLPAYESTIRSLINVNPATLKMLPGEPGAPDYAFADVQAGAVAFVNHGDSFFANLDWRNYGYNNNSFVDIVPSQVARVDYNTGTTEIAAQILMPSNSATVQADGNLTGTTDPGVKVLDFGNYLIVLNDGTTAYSAKLPVGIGLAEDLISHNFYSLSTSSSSPTTVSVAAGKAAFFWLNASSVVSSLGSGVDVGTVGAAGSNSYSNGVYTVAGAGADIGETADAFHFVPSSITGNATITAQVLSQTASNSLAQAGVMMRDGTSAGAAFAAVVRTPGGGVRFVYRTSTGAAAAWVAVPDPLSDVYVKLTRSGSNISGYYSTDGMTWTQIGSTQTITLSNPLAGLAVSSHSTTATSTATFGNVTLNVAVAPTLATSASASATTITGTTVNLSVLGADAGGESGLTYTWTVLGTPPDQVAYSANGANAAKNTTVTFATAGTYNFVVTIENPSGGTATSSVAVTVLQTPTSLSVSDIQPVISAGSTDVCYATLADQFGHPLQSPGAVTWSVNSGGIGSIDQTGLYTAPASGGGSVTITAASGTFSGSASITILGIFTGSQDIGSPSPAGSASYNSSTGTYTISGSGSDVWGTSDQFHYVYESLIGNGTITAYVASETDTNQWTKCGLMFRNDLDANAAYAFLAITPTTSEGTTFQYRSGDGASAGQSIQTTGTGTAAPGWLQLMRVGNTFTAYTSTNGTTWTAYGTAESISMGSTIYVGLVVCSHSSGSLATATFTNVSATQASRTFADNQDIGGPSPAGTYSESGGVITMTAGGADIWGTSDQFSFASLPPVTGNATITARVTSLTDTNANAKAGVMIRNSLTANSAYAIAFVNPAAAGTAKFEYRASAGAAAISNATATAISDPYWIRISRSGNSFTAWIAPDNGGVAGTWTQLGTTQTITMGASVFVGLAVTSHDNGTAATATFDNVSITSTADTAPTIATAASASPSTVTGTTANLSVLGADDGGESNLSYTWSLANLAAGAVTFSANGTNAAKNTVATFTHAGTYVPQVTIADSGDLYVTSQVTVTVNQTLTAVSVSPASPSVSPASTQQFTAIALDQFGNPMATQPSFTWSLASGSGSINSTTGLYTAGLASASASVKATTGSISGTDAVTVTNQSPLLAKSTGVTAAMIDASEYSISAPFVDDNSAGSTYAWTAVGNPPAPVTFGPATANTTATFTKTGTYTLQVTDTDSGGLSTSSTVVLAVELPAWLGPTSIASWNPTMQILTVTGATSIIADPGSDEPVIQASGSAAIVTINPASGTDIHIGGLSLTNGASATVTSLGSSRSATNYRLLIVGTPGASAVPLYTIDSTSTLDLTDNDMAILYGSGTSPLSTITTELHQAYDNDLWDKPGLTSSIARSNVHYGLGYGEASTLGYATFDGLTLGGNAVLVKYTLIGDLNLDGTVDSTDIALLAPNYGQAATSWTQGDVNYDGSVDAADLALITPNYGQSAYPPSDGLTPAIHTATDKGTTTDVNTVPAPKTKPAHSIRSEASPERGLRKRAKGVEPSTFTLATCRGRRVFNIKN